MTRWGKIDCVTDVIFKKWEFILVKLKNDSSSIIFI